MARFDMNMMLGALVLAVFAAVGVGFLGGLLGGLHASLAFVVPLLNQSVGNLLGGTIGIIAGKMAVDQYWPRLK